MRHNSAVHFEQTEAGDVLVNDTGERLHLPAGEIGGSFGMADVDVQEDPSNVDQWLAIVDPTISWTRFVVPTTADRASVYVQWADTPQLGRTYVVDVRNESVDAITLSVVHEIGDYDNFNIPTGEQRRIITIADDESQSFLLSHVAVTGVPIPLWYDQQNEGHEFIQSELIIGVEGSLYVVGSGFSKTTEGWEEDSLGLLLIGPPKPNSSEIIEEGAGLNDEVPDTWEALLNSDVVYHKIVISDTSVRSNLSINVNIPRSGKLYVVDIVNNGDDPLTVDDPVSVSSYVLENGDIKRHLWMCDDNSNLTDLLSEYTPPPVDIPTLTGKVSGVSADGTVVFDDLSNVSGTLSDQVSVTDGIVEYPSGIYMGYFVCSQPGSESPGAVEVSLMDNDGFSVLPISLDVALPDEDDFQASTPVFISSNVAFRLVIFTASVLADNFEVRLFLTRIGEAG